LSRHTKTKLAPRVGLPRHHRKVQVFPDFQNADIIDTQKLPPLTSRHQRKSR
jgi:hypothetical protein